MKRKSIPANTKPSHLRDAKQMKRQNRVTMLLNDKELRAIEKYCHRYQIHNRSKLIRELVMKQILHRFEQDTPTLFD